jgi:hypothetical protein
VLQALRQSEHRLLSPDVCTPWLAAPWRYRARRAAARVTGLHQCGQHYAEAGGILPSLGTTPPELLQIAPASLLHADPATPRRIQAIHLERDGLHRSSRGVPGALGISSIIRHGSQSQL